MRLTSPRKSKVQSVGAVYPDARHHLWPFSLLTTHSHTWPFTKVPLLNDRGHTLLQAPSAPSGLQKKSQVLLNWFLLKSWKTFYERPHNKHFSYSTRPLWGGSSHELSNNGCDSATRQCWQNQAKGWLRLLLTADTWGLPWPLVLNLVWTVELPTVQHRILRPWCFQILWLHPGNVLFQDFKEIPKALGKWNKKKKIPWAILMSGKEVGIISLCCFCNAHFQ